jgi:hypothetical protein
MHSPRPVYALRRTTQGAFALLLLGCLLLVSGCGGSAQLQQQAGQDQAQLDRLLQHAQAIGVPASLLNPIQKQEQQLRATSAPFDLFNDQSTNAYYHNLSTRYTQLQIQLQGLIAVSTQQSQAQALHDMQDFHLSLTREQAQGLPIQKFSQAFSQDQAQFARARYPKDYFAISSRARNALQALNLLQTMSAQLDTFQQTITQMQAAHLDVTALQTQYLHDQQLLTSATMPPAFEQLGLLVDAQYQQAVVNSTQALPFITAAKLNEFANQIAQLKTYGVDVSTYQQRLDADRAAMRQALSIQGYTAFAKQVDADIASLHATLLQGEATYLVKQFHQEVTDWGQAHLYHDKFDGNNYPLDAGYMQQGIGSDLDGQLAAAATPDDFQAVVDAANNALFNLHLLEADYSDSTPYDQVHATDLQMLAHYQLQNKQVLMVSLVEQAMRVYQDGKLVRSFHVTTGRVELPAVPGVWPVLDRLSPTVFKSPDPPGSPYWYPDTPIHYAILYHQGGYFVHDSWWRADYGPGTQFPHYDSGGDESFAGDGSHGCINMQEDQAAWVYNNTDWNTLIVVY